MTLGAYFTPLNAFITWATGNTNQRGRLSKIDLLNKIACFVKSQIVFFNIKSSWSKLVSIGRSTVLSLPPSVRVHWSHPWCRYPQIFGSALNAWPLTNALAYLAVASVPKEKNVFWNCWEEFGRCFDNNAHQKPFHQNNGIQRNFLFHILLPGPVL